MTDVPTADRATYLARLAQEMQASPEEEATARTVIDKALEVVPDADHASITVRAARRRFRSVGALSDLAAELDALQYELEQGPCVESVREGQWFRSGDLHHDLRWPDWSARAADRGIGSILSLRLVARDDVYGALNLYARERHAFDDRDEVDLAGLFAVHAGLALAASREASGLEAALASRHDVGVAQGIIIARFEVSLDESFAVLRRISQATNTKLRDVAQVVVRDREVPEIPAVHGDTPGEVDWS